MDTKSGTAKEIAQDAITGIMDVERKLVKRLHQHFEEEAEETFKVLRLALPVTQAKLDWDVNLAKVYSQLQGAKK